MTQSFKLSLTFFSLYLSLIWLLSSFLSMFELFEGFFFFLVLINESLSSLQSRAFFLSETQHLASAPCQRAVCQCACESQITLWWRVVVVIVVCTLHLPSHTYEDLLKKRAEQREPALTWQATMATGKEAGRTEAGGRHTRGWWELLWPACRGHNAQVELAVIIWLLRRTNKDETALAACSCSLTKDEQV